MCFTSIKNAKKWFIDKFDNTEMLQYWKNSSYVREKYEQEHPDNKVIDSNGKLQLGGQEVKIDLDNNRIEFQSTHGPYRAKFTQGKKDVIRLNREILDSAIKESFRIRILDLKNQKRYLLKETDIKQVRKRRPIRMGSQSLYPVFLESSLEEKKTPLKKPEGRATKSSENLTKYLQ